MHGAYVHSNDSNRTKHVSLHKNTTIKRSYFRSDRCGEVTGRDLMATDATPRAALTCTLNCARRHAFAPNGLPISLFTTEETTRDIFAAAVQLIKLQRKLHRLKALKMR